MNASTLVVLTQMLSQSMMADVYNLSLNIPKLFGLAAYPFSMFDLTKLMMPEKCPFYGLAWYIMVCCSLDTATPPFFSGQVNDPAVPDFIEAQLGGQIVCMVHILM